ncbi:Uu.00g106230.m01.CDS01 [Anthostomella pinea]|uniref:Uu.00g106230.m01.CDS01 n=1 Tax=Anthostomella pinea TaxID=933095 RepID=A0AAI8VEL3_9PEZI|nr:Uu.00g106230.m01.CDS01 [Anthostomella pinea]
MAYTAHIVPSSSRTASPAASSPEPSSNMTKATTDSTKGGKRKGMLQTVRANDREAQRAIRARTKEHIESLERELDELRSRHNRDHAIQDLLRRNKALEDEVHRLRNGLGMRTTGTSGPYQARMLTAHQHANIADSRADWSVEYKGCDSGASSFGQSTPEYSMMSDIPPPYHGISATTDGWPSAVPCSVPSNVSSPSSSSGANEDFVYYPTSAPSAVFERTSIPATLNSPAASCIGSDAGFDDVKSEFGCPSVNIMPLTPSYHHQPWNVYPVYYQASPAAL